MNKLHRSDSERILFGVCGGVGDYLKVDATIVRLVWCGLGLLWGYGVALYVIAAFLVPRMEAVEATEPPEEPPTPRKRTRRAKTTSDPAEAIG